MELIDIIIKEYGYIFGIAAIASMFVYLLARNSFISKLIKFIFHFTLGIFIFITTGNFFENFIVAVIAAAVGVIISMILVNLIPVKTNKKNEQGLIFSIIRFILCFIIAVFVFLMVGYKYEDFFNALICAVISIPASKLLILPIMGKIMCFIKNSGGTSKFLRITAVFIEIGSVILFFMGVFSNTNGFEYGIGQFWRMIPLIIVIFGFFWKILLGNKSPVTFFVTIIFMYGSVYAAYGSYVDLNTETFLQRYSVFGSYALIAAALGNAFAVFLAFACSTPGSVIFTNGTWWALFALCAYLAVFGVYEFMPVFAVLALVTFLIAIILSIASALENFSIRRRSGYGVGIVTPTAEGEPEQFDPFWSRAMGNTKAEIGSSGYISLITDKDSRPNPY